jgi:hypothetical protein
MIRPPSRGSAERVFESTQKVLNASAMMLNITAAIIIHLIDPFPDTQIAHARTRAFARKITP